MHQHGKAARTAQKGSGVFSRRKKTPDPFLLSSFLLFAFGLPRLQEDGSGNAKARKHTYPKPYNASKNANDACEVFRNEYRTN
jgi:hypothetical protein